MAYSATLANQRGLLSDDEHLRLLTLFSRAGLSIDHPQFDDEILDKGTAAILKTRDGLLRLAVPNPLGRCTFINDVSPRELRDALRKHKKIVGTYPRAGAGLEAYVDSSDTGYADNETESLSVEQAAKEAGVLSETQAISNGLKDMNGASGHAKGLFRGHAKELADGVKAQA